MNSWFLWFVSKCFFMITVDFFHFQTKLYWIHIHPGSKQLLPPFFFFFSSQYTWTQDCLDFCQSVQTEPYFNTRLPRIEASSCVYQYTWTHNGPGFLSVSSDKAILQYTYTKDWSTFIPLSVHMNSWLPWFVSVSSDKAILQYTYTKDWSISSLCQYTWTLDCLDLFQSLQIKPYCSTHTPKIEA